MNTRRTFLKTASLAAVTTGLMDLELLARAASLEGGGGTP